ncbi:MAG: hypothetical protein NW214_02730 [Pseudanabaenaceae cyanobacterium bins.39]|nr:hypothetical protein [Pseudanabaenaceae cyanobacterium bins.39]
MTVNVSESLYEQLVAYLRIRSESSDRVAQSLLKTLEQLVAEQKTEPVKQSKRDRHDDLAPQFATKLFEAWQELADLQVGENYWSYPVMFEDLAEAMEISVDEFVAHLANVQIGSLQLIQGRGFNYQINNQLAASLTFHSTPTPKKAAIPNLSTKKSAVSQPTKTETFKIGDRVKVNANRQQYANHTGVVEQVISVSCRVKLDNGWTAFLPNHCLDRID